MKASMSVSALAICAGILTAAALPGFAQTKPAPKMSAKPKVSASAHKTSLRSRKHHRNTKATHASGTHKTAPQKKN